MAMLIAVAGGTSFAGERVAPLAVYAAAAKAADARFAGFSAARGKALFFARFHSGKAETPSCTTCHTENPRESGQTRAGKAIDPMAASINPKRYADLDETEKWFGRNCRNVLGRECTAVEKGDFIAFMLTQ
jgi:cytochrome c peroxidase